MLQRLQRKWDKIKRFARRYPVLLFVVTFSFAMICAFVALLSVFVSDKGKDVFLTFFVALITAPTMLLLIASLAIGRFTRLSNLASQLFDPDEAKRRQAFGQLLQKGNNAVKIFVRVLNEAPYDIIPEAICLAVEGLGRLKAKEGVDALMEAVKSLDPDIRATAIWALAQIGDERAVKAIIPLLANKSRIERQKWLNDWVHEVLKTNEQITSSHFGTVGAIASAALVQLGQEDLVNAFWKALKEKDEDAVKCLKAMKEFRKEIVEALVVALNVGLVGEATDAAHLLGELWAFDALPTLRSKARALSTPEKVREVCLEAIAKLEQLSRLPMPATATEIDKSILPRPASMSEIAVDKLPRPANPPQNSGG